jgi:hypothetical protein
MLSAVGGPKGNPESFCHACFSGNYEIPFVATSRRQMRLVGV